MLLLVSCSLPNTQEIPQIDIKQMYAKYQGDIIVYQSDIDLNRAGLTETYERMQLLKEVKKFKDVIVDVDQFVTVNKLPLEYLYKMLFRDEPKTGIEKPKEFYEYVTTYQLYQSAALNGIGIVPNHTPFKISYRSSDDREHLIEGTIGGIQNSNFMGLFISPRMPLTFWLKFNVIKLDGQSVKKDMTKYYYYRFVLHSTIKS